MYDMRSISSTVEVIRIVKDFLDVFPEELLGLSPYKEVKFGIEIFPSIAPVSIAPYCMVTKKLKELKLQLEKLLDREFFRPNMSSWGVLVLFVKKKRWVDEDVHGLSTVKHIDDK